MVLGCANSPSVPSCLINHGLATELPTEAGDDDRVLDTAVLSMSLVSSTFGCETTDFFRGFSEKIPYRKSF